MASIFNKTNNLYENPKRNTFDHSFQNNLTFNFGELVPCFCKECIPGDSFKIDPTLSLKMIPMLFPVQTRIRAHVHFFYVPNRALWSDWMDFIGNTKENLEIPYIKYNKNRVYTGSLYDYMGLPTTSVGQEYIQTIVPESAPFTSYPDDGSLEINNDKSQQYLTSILPDIPNTALGLYNILYSSATSEQQKYDLSRFLRNMLDDFLSTGVHYLPIFKDETTNTSHVAYFPLKNVRKDVYGYLNSNGNLVKDEFFIPLFSSREGNVNQGNNVYIYMNTPDGKQTFFVGEIESREGYNETYFGFDLTSVVDCGLYLDGGTDLSMDEFYGNLSKIPDFRAVIFAQDFTEGVPRGVTLSEYLPNTEYSSSFSYYYKSDGRPLDISDEDVNVNVYDTLKINALPFRAYEAIYNSFYRDERNNPLMENGEPVYNKYIINNSGGVDNFNFGIRKRNWEADFLTTAVQSPQQGVAPLVGITSYGEISFQDETTGELYTAKLNAQDGDTIDSFTVTSANMPNGNLRQLVDFASSGISISDLRGVNALQRWLEINMRRGLRYKDQIMSHFGVDVRYDELLMPEFIGGFSEDVYVNQINQTTNMNGDPLGSYAGQGGSFGSSKHSITHFCQEHGYIIGVISVSPVANYSQLLPKHFLKRELLDYFFPEFGHLGMQPILYNEVCPIESFNSNIPLSDVFGYQRAWYDYLASTDEVHGLFRTSLRNFVVGRKFSGAPELGSDFLTIDHKEIDDIFAVTSSDSSHKFLGQIYFDCKIKRPIPEYGIPKLEV